MAVAVSEPAPTPRPARPAGWPTELLFGLSAPGAFDPASALRDPAEFPRRVLEGRAASVFVCTALRGADDHAGLRGHVYPRLISDAQRRGVALAFVDFTEDMAHVHSRGATEELHARALHAQLQEVLPAPAFVQWLQTLLQALPGFL